MYNISKSKVRKIMKDKGISTQQELAEKLDISKNQLSMLLSPSFNPVKSNAIKLCNELGVSFEEIIDSEQIEMDLGTPYESEDNIKNFDRFAFEVNQSIDVRDITPNKDYTVLELFAGAGGLALGLEKAGFKSKGLVEYDKYACQTLRYNRPSWNVIHKDIVEVAERGIKQYVDVPIGELDLLSGGYPCQTFSYAGNKMGLSDARGTLFYHYAQILKQLLPKTFIAENVRGLVNHDNGLTLSLMIKVFSEIGYKVKWKVLKALDYNVAQKRERIVIVGIRDDLAEKYKLEYFMPEPYGSTLTLRDVLKDVPPSEGAKYPEKKRQVLEHVPPGGYWKDLPDEIAKNYMGKSYYSGGGRTGMARRLAWNEPSLTLTTSPAQKQTERCHPDETRPFTVREYARIQSFPDDWHFNCSMNNAYKQIGNAVPINLAEAVGLSMINILNQMED